MNLVRSSEGQGLLSNFDPACGCFKGAGSIKIRDKSAMLAQAGFN
jgi:hypothetical protein